jgi:hypothetical protein
LHDADGFFWFLGHVVRRLWLSRKVTSAAKDPEDAHLMKVSYLHDRDPEALRLAYLRSLTSDRATLVVTDRALRIGSQLKIHLGSLHAHPQLRSEPVLGKVVQTKKLENAPDNFLINVEFMDNAIALNALSLSREKTS